jgi:hypothetical protein
VAVEQIVKKGKGKGRKKRKRKEKGKRGGKEEGRTNIVLNRARDNMMVEQNGNLPLPAIGAPHALLLQQSSIGRDIDCTCCGAAASAAALLHAV